MLPELLQRVSLFRLLHRIDLDLAARQQQARCPYCGGPLHKAPYLRQPRGGPEEIPDEWCYRLSLCCGRENCRRRVLPPSCLFMGRRVYWGCVILVVMTLHQQRSNGLGVTKLMRMFSVPCKTILRWISYFRDEFPTSAQWKRIRGQVIATVTDQDLPGALVEHFLQRFSSIEDALSHCLLFLSSGGQAY